MIISEPSAGVKTVVSLGKSSAYTIAHDTAPPVTCSVLDKLDALLNLFELIHIDTSAASGQLKQSSTTNTESTKNTIDCNYVSLSQCSYDTIKPNRDVWIITTKYRKSNLGQEELDITNDQGFLFATRRFAAACKRRGLRARIFSADDVDFELKNSDTSTTHLASPYLIQSRHGMQRRIRNSKHMLSCTDATPERMRLPLFVIANTSMSEFRELMLLRLLENMGVAVVNSPQSKQYCANKIYTYSVLAANAIPIPRSVLLDMWHHDRSMNSDCKQILIAHGLQLPLVLKTMRGQKGEGVFLARTQRDLEQLMRTAIYFKDGESLIVQECVISSMGKDIRVWVVGDQAVAWMMRCNDTKDEFRSNLGAGGKAVYIELDDVCKELAVNASLALGLDYCGVDLLFNGVDVKTGKQTYKVVEVNSLPGWQGTLALDEWRGFDLTECVLKHVCKKYNIPVV